MRAPPAEISISIVVRGPTKKNAGTLSVILLCVSRVVSHSGVVVCGVLRFPPLVFVHFPYSLRAAPGLSPCTATK